MGDKAPARRSTGTSLVFGIAFIFLLLAAALLYVGWDSDDGELASTMTFGGYVATTLGVVVAFVVGIGLLSLLYYNGRGRGL
jgi:hypothetical protein